MILVLHACLSNKENKMMNCMKMRSKTFAVVKDCDSISHHEKMISVKDVMMLFRERLNKNRFRFHVIFSCIFFVLYGVLSPLIGSAMIFENILEAMPHNHLRLMRHLRRIRKQGN